MVHEANMDVPEHISHAIDLAHINNVPRASKEPPVASALLLVPERRIAHLKLHPVTAVRVESELSELFSNEFNVFAARKLSAQITLSTNSGAIALCALRGSAKPSSVEEVNGETSDLGGRHWPKCVAAGGLIEGVGWAATGHYIGTTRGQAGLGVVVWAPTGTLLDLIEGESERGCGKNRENDGVKEHLGRLDDEGGMKIASVDELK